MRALKFAYCFSLVLLLATPADAAIFESTTQQTTLLELYSSEGCSSCPPADQWVSSMQVHPELWEKFVPVVFHVTYWDYLGRKDRFAKPMFDERQREYVRQWNGSSVYTPGVVVDGKEWRTWYLTKDFQVTAREALGILRVETFEEDRYEVSFFPLADSGVRYEAHAALLGLGLKSKVQMGENRGKTLKHDFVALEATKRPLVQARQGDGYEAEFVLPTPDLDAQTRYAIAVWLTRHNDPTPLQAVGGYLEG